MAEELDDGGFWLPPDFLIDDDPCEDFKTKSYTKKSGDDFSYGFGNSFLFNSDLGSPIESLGCGTTETESDEDDFIAGLARKIANSTLQQPSFSSDHTAANGWNLSRSPQSTLCMCRPDPDWDIPRVSSPPGPVEMDFLYATAGEFARMRLIKEMMTFHSSKHFFPSPKPSPTPVPPKYPNMATEFYPNQIEYDISHRKLRATQLQEMKQQQMMRNGVWGKSKVGCQFQNKRRNEAGRASSSPMVAWPTLQQSQLLNQKPGLGTLSVNVGETGVKKERTGTGVFIPKGSGTNASTEWIRKKPGCSISLPVRVVHSLNLNLDSVDTPENDAAALKQMNNVMMGQQRRNLRSKQPSMNQELGLPQEWTY